MNDINKALSAINKELTIFWNNDMFRTDIFLNNIRSDTNFPYCQSQFSGYQAYPFDFYLCMLCAGVTEDMIFSHTEGIYDSIEGLDAIFYRQTSFDPIIAVYAGRHDFAKRLMDITGNYIYDRIIEAKCWDFIDKITDCGKNKNHIEIMIWLLVKDYLRGKNNFFEYVTRYDKNELLTCGEAIDNALREINNADEIFEAISQEAYKILNKFASDTDRKKFNERAVDLMQRCARLGLTLKEFNSFNNILLPIPAHITEDLSGNPFMICEGIPLPKDMAALIDENTVVCDKYEYKTDKTIADICDDNEKTSRPCNFSSICYFDNETNDDNFTSSHELAYICIDFQKRYGRKLVIRFETYDDLMFSNSHYHCEGLFDADLGDNVLEEFYRNINSLKKALNYGRLSQKNIEEITKYFASKIDGTSGSDYSFAVKRLNQLNNKLIKMGGKVK